MAGETDPAAKVSVSPVTRARPWLILAGAVLAFILVPFFLFEQDIQSIVDRALVPQASASRVAGTIIGLLALDVFLPVPSSIVSTAAGAYLGFASGMLASTAGMTLGCVLAFGLSRRFGVSVVRRLLSEREMQQVSALLSRNALWAIACLRPVPVLAEASVLLAPVARAPFGRYLLITTLANAGVSAVYAAAGASAVRTGSFFLAVAGAIVLPGCALLIRRRLLRRNG